jgi:hypothetical protein
MNKSSMVSHAWVMWFVAAALELAAVVVDFVESGRIKWLYVGPLAWCLGMAFWTRRTSRQ